MHTPAPSITLGTSLRKMTVALLGGAALLAFGLAIEFVEPLHESIPLHGWVIAVLGGALVAVGGFGLIVRPTLLVVNEDGLRVGLRGRPIAWDQIASVRGHVDRGTGLYLLVKLRDAEAATGARWTRLKYSAARAGKDEVPISVTGADVRLDRLVEAINSYLCARAERLSDAGPS